MKNFQFSIFNFQKEKGFTLFVAMIVMGTLLLVSAGIVALHERQPCFGRRVIFPGGIAHVLQERGRDDTERIFEAGGSERSSNRRRHIV